MLEVEGQLNWESPIDFIEFGVCTSFQNVYIFTPVRKGVVLGIVWTMDKDGDVYH